MRAMSGYSGTPLVAKLGLAPAMKLLVIGKPEGYEGWLGDLPPGAAIMKSATSPAAVHLFATEAKQLENALAKLRRTLQPDGFVWVSWPKKASKVTTDITEDAIRAIALPMGFVDVKVCAVTDVWSGLKLVIRRSERTK
jgi:hypothetical protein